MTINEINFCKYFESDLLPNRGGSITNEMINKGFEILGDNNDFCVTCLERDKNRLLNRYNALLPYWNDVRPTITQTITVEIPSVIEVKVTEEDKKPIKQNDIKRLSSNK